MKKTMILGMALGLALTATSALAVSNVDGGGGIVGSYHDLSAAAYGDTQSRICVFCHHPHQSQTDTGATGSAEDGNRRLTYMPLWNHDVTQTVFTPYSNGNGPTTGRNALNADVSAGPGGVSLLCLSCHDGSVALNAYSNFSTAGINGAQGVGDQAIPGGSGTFPGSTEIANSRALIGGNGDLSNHHPIGFNYLDVVADDAEIALTTRQVNSTGTTIKDLLYGNTQFECVTCHDVHNSQNPGAEKFLWISNDNSNFCLTCHLKDGLAQTDAAALIPSAH